MTWRSLLISKGGKLSLHQQQMLIQQEGNEFTAPLEDYPSLTLCIRFIRNHFIKL